MAQGWAPLHHAALRGHCTLVNALLLSGAKPSVESPQVTSDRSQVLAMTQDCKTIKQHAVLAALWHSQHQHMAEGHQGAVPVETAIQTMQLHVPAAFKQPQMQCLLLKNCMACRV